MLSLLQLSDCGLDRSAVGKRVAQKVLFRATPAVYSLVPPPWPWMSRVWAARLWGGEDGVLSNWTAANLENVLRPRHHRRIDVTLPTRRRSNSLINVHYARALDPDDVTTTDDGFTVTTWARTALDLAATEPTRTVEILLNQAVVQNLFDLALVEAVLARSSGHHGLGRAREALEQMLRGTTVTDSELEEAFLAICDGAGLPRPRTQKPLGPGRLDFHWADYDLTVEVDSWRYHRHPDAFHADRDKDLRLREQGKSPPLRFTDWLVIHQPGRIRRLLIRALRPLRAAA